MKKEKNDNSNYIKETIIIIIVGILINVLCFLMPLTVNAASQVNEPWPYIVNQQNSVYNSSIVPYLDGIVESVKDKFDYDPSTDDPFLIVIKDVWWKDTDTSDPYWAMEGFVYWNVTFDDTLGSNFTDKSFQFQANYGNIHRFDIWLDTYRIYSYDNRVSGDFYCLGQPQTTNLSIGTLTPDYIIYCSDDIIDNSSLVVSMNGNNNIVGYVDSPLISSFVSPNLPSVPTIETPSIDTDLSIIENIKILFSWLGNTIKSFFQWIINVIVELFSCLFTNLKNFINAIISALNNGFKNFTNNLSSFFYPFFTFFTGFAQGVQDFFDEFTDPNTGFLSFIRTAITNIRSNIASMFDAVISIKNFLFGVQGFFDTYGVIWNQDTWADALDDSPWLDAVSDNTTTLTQFVNGTLNVAEPEHLSFTMDFRNAHYNFGLVTWDLSWYEPYKNSVRLAFVGICVLNAVVYFIDEAPNWFSGGGSNKKGDK